MNFTEGSKRIFFVLIGLIVLLSYIFLGNKLFFFFVCFFAGLVFIIWYIVSGFRKKAPARNDNSEDIEYVQETPSKAKNTPRRK